MSLFNLPWSWMCLLRIFKSRCQDAFVGDNNSPSWRVERENIWEFKDPVDKFWKHEFFLSKNKMEYIIHEI